MKDLRSAAQEAAEDIFFGQNVIIWARWFVILAATMVLLWSSNSIEGLTAAILMVVPLIVINFFVHGRYLMEKPINKVLLVALSLVDILIVTLFVLLWGESNGLSSPFYVYYYPLLLAFAFVFSARVSAVYTVLTLAAYGLACALVDTSTITDPHQLEQIVLRLITMAAMGGLGTYYYRIQRNRRRRASGGRQAVAAGS